MEKFYSRSSDHEISLGEILKLPMGLDDYLKWEPGVYGFEKNISFRNMIDTLKQISIKKSSSKAAFFFIVSMTDSNRLMYFGEMKVLRFHHYL